MSKHVKLVLAFGFAFALGLGINNFAMSGVPANYKVAVVDVQKIVMSSKQVAVLKKEQEQKALELKSFVEKAQRDVNGEKDNAKKQAMANKYDKELLAKREANDKAYAKRLTDIDKNISAVINQKSKDKGYDLVLAKGVVLYGGDDFTAEIIKAVK